MERFQKRNNRVSVRSIHNLCPNCFSRLIKDDVGNVECSGDRLKIWQEEANKFIKMSPTEQQQYLDKLGNSSGFLNLINFNSGKVVCDFSNKLSPVLPDDNCRIPDPLAVVKLERKLKRSLTDLELEEGFIFTDGYQLPFINFPEDV